MFEERRNLSREVRPHPAKFSDEFIPMFAKALIGCETVYDPMAGTGKLGLIKEHGFRGKIFCTEIEPEWTRQYEGVDLWSICDATDMPFMDDSFDAICTSPPFGNRMADNYNFTDGSKRITYRTFLSRPLNLKSVAGLQWGERYREVMRIIYAECRRVLKFGGPFILNMSDHIRNGKQVPVTDWHKRTLIDLGFELLDARRIKTRRMGFGANRDKRVDHEWILFSRLR
jgi:tRNA G10  N-methylase Trm11